MTQGSLLPPITLEQRVRAASPSNRSPEWMKRKLQRIAIGLDCCFCFQLMSMEGGVRDRATSCVVCQALGPPEAWWPDLKPKRARAKKVEDPADRWKPRLRKWSGGGKFWIVADGHGNVARSDAGMESHYPDRAGAQWRADQMNGQSKEAARV